MAHDNQFEFPCNMCDFVVQAATAETVLNHLKLIHSLARPFHFICQIPHCGHPSIFESYSSYRRHWYRKHKPQLLVQAQNFNEADAPVAILGAIGGIEENLDSDEDEFMPEDVDEESSVSDGEINTPRPLDGAPAFQPSISDREWKSGTLLYLRERFYVPYEGLEFIDTAFEEYVERKMSALKEKMFEHGILQPGVQGEYLWSLLMETFAEETSFTRSKMETSWKKYFPTVEPIPVVLNKDCPEHRWTNDGNGNATIEEVDEVGYIVPFKEAVQQFLSIDQVHESVLQSFVELEHSIPRQPTSISDIWDGSFVRNNPVFLQQNGHVLGFQFYFDDVELGNPLGSAKGKHKLSMFYWTLMNLPPSSRSNLRAIQLLGCVSSDLLKKHGVEKFLAPVVSDLIEFQNGVELRIGEETSVFHGVLLDFVGDMPASNFVAGFKETAAASHPCRICYVTKEEQNSVFRESQCRMRDIGAYTEELAQLSDPNLSPAGRSELSRELGINRSCPFSALNYFDPTKQFPHDLMHMAYEGVLNWELCLLLNHYLKLNLIDLDVINHSISQLNPSREFTRPPPIRKDEVRELKKLSYSSSEMSSLCSILPLILGDHFSIYECPFYANFIRILEICASLQCHSFTKHNLADLTNKVHTHNEVFLKLFEDSDSPTSITPKEHAFLHFMSQILCLGAPRVSWCFRFESANARFKKFMKRNCNFSNVPYSMAIHFQKLAGLNAKVYGKSDYFERQLRVIKFNPKSKHPSMVQHSPWLDLVLNSTLPLNNVSLIRFVQKISLSGRFCFLNTVFMKKSRDRENPPDFWRIFDMFISCADGQLFLVMQNFETICFDENHFSFVVDPKPNCFSIISVKQLEFVIPLQSFFHRNKHYVLPNYYHMV